MPIRFRCPTCTGLMSIARRKASAVVGCPKCGEQVIVPEPEAVAVANGPPSGPLFERPDFDRLLSDAGVKPVPTPARPVAVAEPAPPAPLPAVITLSYPAAAGLAAATLVLCGAGFAAGYLSR